MIDRTISHSVEVPVNPATAFQIFTDEVGAWYLSGPQSWNDPQQAVGMLFEPGVDGRWMEIWDEETGEGYEVGRIRVWEPGSRLVFTYRTVNMPPTPATEVEVRFIPSDGGTLVTLDHRGWDALPPGPATERFERTREGWGVVLRAYATYAARRRQQAPGREAAFPAAAKTPPVELGYFALAVADVDRAKTFFGALFGWSFAPTSERAGAHIENTKIPGAIARGPAPVLYFRVGDIRAAIARLVALGGRADEPIESASGWSASCTDDQGTRFDLWQPARGY
jgi:predicted enzyme related to lactoylglutathione lyase/uncharacterized protein YndB with AHSA1/START domain